MTTKRVVFRWSNDANLQLLKLVAIQRPTNFGQWDTIATTCTTDFGDGKTITPRGVKDRFRHLIQTHKTKTRENLAK